MADIRYFGYAAESTFKTTVAAARYVDQVRSGIEGDRGWIASDTVEKRARTKFKLGAWLGRGPLDTIVEPENVTSLFKWLLGAVTTTGAGPYTHVFKTGDDILSFTGRLGANLRERLLGGCLLESARFEARAGRGDAGLLRATWEILGTKIESDGAIGSPTFSTLTPFVWHEGTVTLNAVNKSTQVKRFALEYRNNIPIDDLYAFSTTEPTLIRVGRADITCDMDIQFDDTAQYDLFKNGTEFAAKFDFVHTTTPYQLTFEMPKVVYRAAVPNPDRREQIVIPASMEARHDTTEATALKITLINQQSAA